MSKFAFNRQTSSATIGSIGMWMLHLVALLFMIYSAYHGIHATSTYRAASGLGNAAGILGIISIEIALAALYLGAVHHRIIGSHMQMAAGATAAVGFTIATLSIIGDSQMQAGLIPPPWLHTYLTVVLPAAPVFMALGVAVTILLSPTAGRKRKEAEDLDIIAAAEHDLTMQTRLAEAQADHTARQIQLDTKLALLDHLQQYASGPDARRMIEATAEREGPNLLRAAGVYVSDTGPAQVGHSTQDASRHSEPVVTPLAYPAGQGKDGNGVTKPLGASDGRPI